MNATPGNGKGKAPLPMPRIMAEIRAEAASIRAAPARPRPPAPKPVCSGVPGDSPGIERARLDYPLAEFLAADHLAFVELAFRAILKREADDAAAAAQIALLARGAPKAEVLGNLRFSPEGRDIGVRIRGLRPRYLLAKLFRVPLLGYLAEWLLALGALPLMLRYQRAGAAALQARLDPLERGMGALGPAHAAMQQEFDAFRRRLDDDLQRALLRLDDLEAQVGRLGRSIHAIDRELPAVRHAVDATTHWLAGLERSFAEIETQALDARRRAHALAATLREGDAARQERRERYQGWAATLAAVVGQRARLLDLGSGDGGWLAELAALGITPRGVEANPVLAKQARDRGHAIEAGEPWEVLARVASGSLDAVTLGCGLAGLDALHLQTIQRALRPGGWLLLRLETEPFHLDRRPAMQQDAAGWRMLLAAAGYRTPQLLGSDGGAALLAQGGSRATDESPPRRAGPSSATVGKQGVKPP